MATERESDLLSSVLQKSGKASAPVFHGKTDKRKQLQSYEFFRNFPEAVPDRTYPESQEIGTASRQPIILHHECRN